MHFKGTLVYHTIIGITSNVLLDQQTSQISCMINHNNT